MFQAEAIAFKARGGITLRVVLRVVIVVVASLLPAKSFGSGAAIGKVCFEGVKAEVVTDESSRDDKGVWGDATYSVEETANPTAQFVLFRKPMLSYKQFPSCDSIIKSEAQRGNEPVLAGRLRNLDIKAHLFTATSGGSNRIQIDEGQFSATLTAITSGPRPAHGGTVDLRKPSWLILTVSKMILTDNVSGMGTIEISTSLASKVGPGLTEINTSGLSIVNAHLALPGGADTTATIGPAAPTDPELFALNLADGRLSLIEGTLSGSPSKHLKGAHLEVGAASFTDPDLAVKNVEVAATRGAVAVTLTGLSGQSAGLRAGGTVLKYDLTSPKVTVQRVTGNAARNPEAFALDAPIVESMKATTESAQVVTDNGGTVLAGAAVLEIAKAGKNDITATSSWTKPNFSAAEFLFPASTVKTAHWNLSGTLNALSVSGDIDSTVQRLQTLVATDRLAIQLSRTKVTNEIRIPIKTNVSNISGTIAVANEDQSGVLTAGLKRFYLDGILIIDLGDVTKTRAEFPVDGVQVGLQAMIATQPFIAGTKPAFGAVGVTGRNRTPMTLGLARSGLFDIAVETVTLGEPVIRIGQDGSEVKASLTLNSTGSVLITSDISTGALLLTRGTFEAKGADGADGIEFHLLEAGKWLDFGGTRVVDPVLKIKTLSVHVDKTQLVEIGFGNITGIRANASLITKPIDPTHPSEVTYSGKLATEPEPFKIDEFAAAHVKIEKVLVIELATISGLKLHIVGADVRFGGDAHITNGNLKLEAVSVQELKVNDKTIRMLQQAHLALSGNIDPGSGLSLNNAPGFSIDIVASGQSDKLTGDGSAHIDAFSGSQQTSFDTGFRCYPDGTNPRDTLKPPIELNFAVAAVDVSAHLREGRLDAEGGTGPFALIAHTKGHSDCNGKSETFVVVAAHKAWTDGICSKDLQIYKCRWEVNIPEVNFKWHMHAQVEFAALPLVMTAPRVRLSNSSLQVCNIGAVAIDKAVTIMGVSLNIETNYPGASDLINNFFNASAVAGQSLAFTSLVNGVGWTASVLGTGVGNLMCIR